jgi:ParB-like chromosome segregation protein Spo0J
MTSNTIATAESRRVSDATEISRRLRWPIDKLIFYARNPRRNDTAADRMCDSIREFRFKIPCLLRGDGELIDGDLRGRTFAAIGQDRLKRAA